MTVNLILEISRALTIIVATILVTRQYRKDHTIASRFLMLGFWLLVLTVVFEVADIGFAIGGQYLLMSPRPSATTSNLPPSVGVIVSIGEFLNLSSSLLLSAGIILLAYGALRMRGARQAGLARAGHELVPEIAELKRAVLPGLRRFRRRMFENPSLDHDDEM